MLLSFLYFQDGGHIFEKCYFRGVAQEGILGLLWRVSEDLKVHFRQNQPYNNLFRILHILKAMFPYFSNEMS